MPFSQKWLSIRNLLSEFEHAEHGLEYVNFSLILFSSKEDRQVALNDSIWI